MRSPHGHAGISFEQRIPSRMDDAESVCLKIRELLQNNGLSKFSFPMELLARECLANAVHHGNGDDPAKFVALKLRVGRIWIRLQVTDEGPGFAWAKMTQKTTDASELSGRGLRIYELYAERIRFNRCGNRITIWIDKKK